VSLGPRRRLVLAGLAAACLAGCQSVPVDRSTLISGRMAMHVDAYGSAPERSVSAHFDLQGDADNGQLELSTPLGTGVAKARWSPGKVQLTTSEGTRDFASLGQLASEALGESVPLQALFDWLRGRPWPGAPSQPAGSGEGFEQLGWVVDLTRFGEGWAQIRRERAPAVSLRVILDAS